MCVDLAALSVALVSDAVSSLGWAFTRQAEDEIGVTFSGPSRPTIHLSLKVEGLRLVATSAVDIPVPRNRWPSAIVDINEFNAKNYRPKCYLSLSKDSEYAMFLGEELHDVPHGTSCEFLSAWIAGHASAFAQSVTKITGVKLDELPSGQD